MRMSALRNNVSPILYMYELAITIMLLQFTI